MEPLHHFLHPLALAEIPCFLGYQQIEPPVANQNNQPMIIYLGHQQKKRLPCLQVQTKLQENPKPDYGVGRLNYKKTLNSEAGWGTAAIGLAAYSRIMLAAKLQRIRIPGIIEL